MNFENIHSWLAKLGVLLTIIGSCTFADAAQAATLVAQYRMEDAIWNGTAGELKDTAGYTGGPFNGRAIGSPAPSPATVGPAITGGTCGYASMPGPTGNGGAFSIPNLPVSTVAGAKTSVSFWMYWDGTNSVMPIGWNTHDLWFSGVNFGFNTGNSDIYGISSAGLANGWHHVVAVFTNGNVTGNQIYIDGVAQILTQRQSTPNNGNAVVQGTLQVGGWTRDTNYRFSGRIDEVKVYNGALILSEVNTLYNETHACPAQAVAQWRMDEESWNGTANEIVDSSGNGNNAQAFNSANTTDGSRAIAGSPGTCRYGVFDNGATITSGYVQTPLPNLTTDFTVTAWIRTTNNAQTGQRILVDDQSNSGGYGISLGDGGAGKIRFYSRGIAPVIIDSAYTIANNTWYFVAAVADITNKKRTLYVFNTAGTLLNSTTEAAWTGGAWGTDAGPVSIGGETNASGEAPATFHFRGNLDEVRVYQQVLSQSELSTIGTETHPCPVPPVLVAQYRMEDAVWNGTVGELKDTAGYTGGPFNGQAIGSPLPTPASASPARPPDPGTCGYATMPGPASNGGAFSIPNLPVSTANDAKTSVSFWMYWDGTNGVMPIGWNRHDLWLVSGYFGFNTFNSDVFGILSAGLANGWHHVVAVFTNGNVTDNQIYIDGVAQVLAQRQGSPNNANAYVQSNLRISGSAQSGYRFSGRIDEVKVYNGAVTPALVTALYNDAHSCGGSVTPSRFNCIESGAAANTGHLYTKLAGTAFTFDVAALKADGTLETGYAQDTDKSVTVELGYATDSSCTGWLAANPAISQTLTFTAADNGRKAAASMTAAKADPNLRCRVTDANQAPNIIGCSTDNFAVRPTGFAISSTDAGNSNMTGAPAIKTGASFNLAATSIPGYDGTPAINNAPGMVLGTPAQGTLGGSFSAAPAATGMAAGNAFFYSEVGNFGLSTNAVFDDIFTSVDQPTDCTADFSNTPVAGKYGCKFGSAAIPLTIGSSGFGRFIPDNFNVSYNTPAFDTACGTFGYVGQTFSFTAAPVITVTARQGTANGLTNATTVNYAGAYMKLTNTSLGLAPYDTTAARYSRFDALGGGLTPVLDTSGLPSAATDPVIGTFTNGVGNLTFGIGTGLLFTRSSTTPNAPFNTDIALALNVFDTDIVAFAGNPASFGTATAGNGIAFSGGNGMRYGRLKLSNAHGSELLDLPVPLVAQYWNGTAFVANMVDSCTAVTVPALTHSGGAVVTPTLNNPLASGNGDLKLQLNPKAKGYVTVTVTTPTWLQYPWSGAATIDPTSRATFGVYKGNNEFIYLRETY